MDRNLDTPKVKDILTKKVIAFRPHFTAFDAVKAFNEHKISAAPVINEKNEVIGYLSENDCIKYLSNSLFYDEASDKSIETIMSKKVCMAESEWDIFELENFFISNHLKSAPVVDSDNRLVGIIARRDIMMALEKSLHDREEYKSDIKKPLELNMHERIKMIIERR